LTRPLAEQSGRGLRLKYQDWSKRYSVMSSEQDLRDRVLKLEMQVEDLQKRVDKLTAYSRELYNYLNQTSSNELRVKLGLDL
jgi:uncharacterized protein YlxW (UPF0749 family)